MVHSGLEAEGSRLAGPGENPLVAQGSRSRKRSGTAPGPPPFSFERASWTSRFLSRLLQPPGAASLGRLYFSARSLGAGTGVRGQSILGPGERPPRQFLRARPVAGDAPTARSVPSRPVRAFPVRSHPSGLGNLLVIHKFKLSGRGGSLAEEWRGRRGRRRDSSRGGGR